MMENVLAIKVIHKVMDYNRAENYYMSPTLIRARAERIVNHYHTSDVTAISALVLLDEPNLHFSWSDVESLVEQFFPSNNLFIGDIELALHDCEWREN